jgi:diguanylate cyclase (GGDEF)-like protein/PAS domain S-box-containing protein
MKNENGTNAEKDLRSIAEALISKEDSYNKEKIDQLSPKEINSLVHELKVYQVELEMQNEELRRAQLELEQIKARYFDIYDLAPEGYLIISEKGIIIESNLTAAVMFGESRESIVKKRFSQYIFIDDQDIYYSYRKQLYEFMQTDDCELRMINRNRSIFWVQMKSTVVMEDGMLNCRMVINDISSRKNAEIDLKENEEKFRLLITQMTQGLVVFETIQDNMGNVIDYCIIDSNEAYEKFSGMKREAIIGKRLLELMPNIEDVWLQKYKYVAITGDSVTFDKYSRDLDMFFEVTAYSPNPKQVAAIFTDITERKRVEVQLKMNMNDLLESQRIAHLGTWRMNLQTDEVVWSDELFKMYGLDPTKAPPSFKEHYKLFTKESWKKLSESIEQTKTLGIPYELELESVHSDGSKRWIWARGEAQKDASGPIVSLWGAAQDITARKTSEEKLLYLSTHDHLTGLYNRRYYERTLMDLDKKENLPLSIIMFDVNGLKLVNDSFGHDLGDELLKRAAETIKKACREDDIIARIGGDEFVLLLPKTSVADTVKIANHIKELTSNEIVANIELSISYGYETKVMESESISEVVVNAENHMYKHKLIERTSIRSKTIELIMSTLFEKSNHEAQHSNRVSRICQTIAAKMDLDQSTINQMRVVGLIHDIGKIGIDENILNKPGSLTSTERVEIERHPEIGWRLLSSTNEFSELAQFVIHHHEKWDGSGYPNGHKGESIPLEARILAVAEAYEAMTSNSPFDKKLSIKDAVAELKRCSGTHFDPKIVEVFTDHVLTENGNL